MVRASLNSSARVAKRAIYYCKYYYYTLSVLGNIVPAQVGKNARLAS